MWRYICAWRARMRMHVHAHAQVTPALLASAVDEPISRPRDDFSPPEVRLLAPHVPRPVHVHPKYLT